MNTETIHVPKWTPPDWMNSAVKGMLHTPGLERWLGRGIALLTFTGRKSGKAYTTPVSYHREGDTVIILTKTFRRWWRNLSERPEVELRLSGRDFRGMAVASVGDERELPTLESFLEHRPVDAKAYGITLTPEGHVPEEALHALLSQIVVIRVTLEPTGALH